MLELIRKGIRVAGVLFFPLMLVAVPLLELGDLLAEAHWRIAVLLGGLRWALLCGYAGILLTLTARARLAIPSWPNRLLSWFLVSLVFTSLGLVSTYGIGGALLIGALALVVAVLQLPLALSPGIAVIHGVSPVSALRRSFGRLIRDLRLLSAIVVLIALPAIVSPLVVGYLLDMAAVTLWTAARGLVINILYAALFLPAVSLAALVALNVNAEHQWQEDFIARRLPGLFFRVSVGITASFLAAFLYFMLTAIIPVGLQIAGSAEWKPGMIFVFTASSPVSLVIFAFPGFLAGWIAARVAKSVWTACIAGLIYGLIVLHVQFGFNLYEPTYLGSYGIALFLYILSGVLGFMLAGRFRTPAAQTN